MTALLEAVARARDARAQSQAAFRRALIEAKTEHSWSELARAANMTAGAVRYIVLGLNERRQLNRRRVRNAQAARQRSEGR